jgi:hypothetical protein
MSEGRLTAKTTTSNPLDFRASISRAMKVSVSAGKVLTT